MCVWAILFNNIVGSSRANIYALEKTFDSLTQRYIKRKREREIRPDLDKIHTDRLLHLLKKKKTTRVSG